MNDQTGSFRRRSLTCEPETEPQCFAGDTRKGAQVNADRSDAFTSVKPHFFCGQIDDAQRNGQFVHSYMVLIRMYRLSALKFIAMPTAIAAATTPAPKTF